MKHRQAPRFLAPTNFGARSRIALNAALGWAAGTGGRVTLLHVLPPDPASTAGLDSIALLHDVFNQGAADFDYRRRALERLGKEHPPELKKFVDVRTELRKGDLAAEIMQYAIEGSYDAIVLGARRWPILGQPSLLRKLAGRTACQVVLVHAPARSLQLASRAAQWLAACGLTSRKPSPKSSAEPNLTSG